MFRIMVRDETLAIIDEHGAGAHDYVVAKLQRTDLTTRYRIMLRDVERQLRKMDVAQLTASQAG
jgi:hypothetical protein